MCVAIKSKFLNTCMGFVFKTKTAMLSSYDKINILELKYASFGACLLQGVPFVFSRAQNLNRSQFFVP